MKPFKSTMLIKTLTILVLFSFSHLGGISSRAPAQSALPGHDPADVRWNRLIFKSGNFLGTVTTRVQIEELAAEAIGDGLLESPGSAGLEPEGAKAILLSVDSAMDPLFGSKEKMATRVWFSPQRTLALQRIRLRQGKEKWEKTYRWTPNGVYRRRLRPIDADEEQLPPTRWTDRQDSFYPYDLEAGNCASVSEPSALLYAVSATGPAVGDPPTPLCVFNKKQLHLVRFTAAKSQHLKINYVVKSEGKESRRKGKAEVLKVSFTSRSLSAGKAEAEPFSFLGLKGDFDIFIDKRSKIPVQVSGRIPAFGRVDFKLGEVQLRLP